MTDHNNDKQLMNNDNPSVEIPKDAMPDWDDLQEMWQEQSPDLDMDKLARHARFVWWRMRFNFFSEIAACLIGISAFILFFDITSIATSLFAIYGSAFCLISLWGSVYIRRGAWGKPDDTALSLLKLQVARAESSIRYVKVNTYLGYGSILILFLGYWVLYEEHGYLFPDFTQEPFQLFFHGLLIGLGISALFVPIFGRSYIRKKQEHIAELEQRIAELTDVD